MTYNFDPYRWYNNELEAIERLYQSGELNDDEHTRQLADLEKRFDDMMERLDGTLADYTAQEQKA